MNEYITIRDRRECGYGYDQVVVPIPSERRRCHNCKHRKDSHHAMSQWPQCNLTGRGVSLGTPACERWEQWRA